MFGKTRRLVLSAALALLMALATAAPLIAADGEMPNQFGAPEAVGTAGTPPIYVGGRAVFESAPSASIPDDTPGGVTSTLDIDSHGAIQDLDVGVLITHSWVGDLQVTLTHVDTGTSALLIDRPGVGVAPGTGCGEDNIDAVLDDEAATPVEDECVASPPAGYAIAGVFIPNNPLSVFDGENINGVWELNVVDAAAGDSGTLDLWTLAAERPADGTLSAIYAAEIADYAADAADKAFATGKLAWLDVYDASLITPTLPDLQQYDSVLTWPQFAYADAVGIGDVLADFVDSGGGVAVATFAWGTANPMVGRIATDSYLPFTTGGPTLSDDGPYELVPTKATHQLLADVSTLSGGTGSYRQGTAVTTGSLLVATWSSPGNEPFVATKAQPTARVVGLNIAPPSSDALAELWDATTDGGELLANALTYAATPPLLCDGQVATIDGTDGPDTLNGTAGDDVIAGGGGDDTIQGGGGNDLICGDDGSDKILGGPGNDTLFGGDGVDTAGFGSATGGVTVNLVAGTATGQGADTLDSVENVIGSSYGDTITGDGGANWLRAFDGNDTVDGGSGDDIVAGGAGNDVLFGGSGADTIEGYEGTDEIRGGPGNDILRGWADDDIIFPSTGNDTILGGNGFDLVDYSNSTSPIIADFIAGTVTGSGSDSIAGIYNMVGSVYDDYIAGNGWPNYLQGAGGNDVLLGNGGDDSLDGWLGADVLEGGPGNDDLAGYDGRDELRGGGNTDLVFGESGDDVLFGGEGPDFLDGGPGIDNLYGGPASDECTNGPGFFSCEVITDVLYTLDDENRFARFGVWAALVEAGILSQ